MLVVSRLLFSFREHRWVFSGFPGFAFRVNKVSHVVNFVWVWIETKMYESFFCLANETAPIGNALENRAVGRASAFAAVYGGCGFSHVHVVILA